MERGLEAVRHVIALERSLLTPEVRGSAEALDGLLDESFTEIGASGRSWTREQLVDVILSAGPVELLAEDFQGTELAPGMVLLAWKSTRGGKSSRRSSLWRHRDGVWRILFHQGTPVPPEAAAG